jgi:hypothetical protein
MGLADRYCENIHNNIEPYYATWLPSLPIKLGDYGRMDGKIFIRQGNIKTDFGVEFSGETDTDAGDYEYKSQGANVIRLDAGAGGAVKAGLKFTFSSKYEVFFLAANCLADLMNNQISVIEQLQSVFGSKKMKGYRIVTQTIKAGTSTVAVSSNKQSELVIEASSDEIKEIDLKNPKINFSVKTEKNIGFKVIAKDGLIPLLGLEEVKI